MNKQGTIVVLAGWLGFLVIVVLAWFMVGPENQWLVTTIYALVVAVVAFLIVVIPPHNALKDNKSQNPKQSGSSSGVRNA